MDSSGVAQQQRQYRWPRNGMQVITAPNNDGGFLMAAKVSGGSLGKWLAWMRIAADGDSLGYDSLAIPDYRLWASAIVPTPDGGYLLAGYANRFEIDSPALLVKLNALGAVEYYRLFRLSDRTRRHRCRGP